MRISKYIIMLPVLAFWDCSQDVEPEGYELQPEGDVYLSVALDEPASRMSYDYTYGSGIYGSGNIRASWQLGDIVKVYETDENGAGVAYSDVYHDYTAYNTAHPYPEAPIRDTYYRFVCVGGEGTSQGIFKYVGLATAEVVSSNNVIVDIKYNHKIRNWEKFQGLAIYGTPLRNQLMRTQTGPNDMSHLRFGERMYANVCSYNFDWYDKDPDKELETVGVERLVMRNVGSCVYRIIIGGIDTDIYGGSTLTLSISGVTDGSGLCGEDMTLTLGSADDYQLGLAPWSKAGVHGVRVPDFLRTDYGYLYSIDNSSNNSGNKDIPKGDGTAESPYNVAQAREIASTSSAPNYKWVYTTGFVLYNQFDDDHPCIDIEAGTGTWEISNDGSITPNRITVFCAKDIGNQNFTNIEKVKSGDKITVYAPLVNYNAQDFSAYIVGWPGKLTAGSTVTVTLKESKTANIYRWELTASEDIDFKAGRYYTIDLRDNDYTKTR